MISCAKALSAAYQPISALMMSEKVYQALESLSAANGTFGHGFTYGGHPVACAVALETLKIYEERNIVGHVNQVSPVMLDGLAAFAGHPLVGDVRGVGLFCGVELMQDRKARTPWPAERKVGTLVQDLALKHGLIVRAIGDRIAFTPPLIITKDEIAEMCRRFGLALDEAQAAMKA